MLIDAAIASASERITERVDDVRATYTPGAVPRFDDVATAQSMSRFDPDPLRAAPPEGAYFITHDGRGRTAYTRDGSFGVRDGALVGEDGRAVFGFATEHAPLGALKLDPVDVALDRVHDVHLERDGALVYTRDAIEPRSGTRERERVTVGYLALARFPAATKLGSVDANHFVAPPGDVPHVGRPGDGAFAFIAPMRREASRVDLDASLIHLKDAYLALDALHAAQTARMGINKTAMDLLK